MSKKRTARQGRVETAPDGTTCAPDEILHWAWTEACAMLYCGEDPNEVSQEELQRRFYRDLRENKPTLMVYVDPRCRVVKMDQLGQFAQSGRTAFVLEYEGVGEADKVSQFARLGDGSLLTVGNNATFTSHDDGVTWSAPRSMCRNTAKSRPEGGLLIRTRQGHLVCAYPDSSTFRWSWDAERHEAADDVRSDVWVIRSEDEGRTWQDKHLVLSGYCGALINMIETADGELVLPIQRLLSNPSRHGIGVYVSSDGGKHWVPSSDIIDLGGHGDHDGAMEPTIVQLRDGRLWMLIRTTLGQFWSAYSSDGGRTWPILRPSAIEASSAPGYLIRLASGRLVFVWNRPCSTQRTRPPIFGGDRHTSLHPFSGHRQELSIAFSEDDGATWSAPHVIIRKQDYGISYPYLFELAPGRIWLGIGYCYRMALTFDERDFVGHSTRQRTIAR